MKTTKTAFLGLLLSTLSLHTIDKHIQGNINSKPVIVIDPISTLFKENKSGLIKHVGLGSLTSYAIKHWKNPRDVCLSVLSKMSTETNQKPTTQMCYNNHIMPRCIEQWYCGDLDQETLRNQINEYIATLDQQHYFKSNQEKELVEQVLNLSFNSNEFHTILQPIQAMISLFNNLKQKGHQIFAIANMAHDTFDTIKKLHPDIIALFDGTVISAEVHSVKPDEKIYQHLCTQHHLDPTKCIYIDTQNDNLAAAEKFGMKTINHSGNKKLRTQLKQHGIDA